ncbi:MAG: flagellar motor switch protein FliN [Chlorobiaceae bacterium]|nr:flagellar motor switch protein FliN [Chlorobiaceae bacterium]MBA4309121.1 flagellar motor switch protein FliN [Chlorobiaceae bacterium]
MTEEQSNILDESFNNESLSSKKKSEVSVADFSEFDESQNRSFLDNEKMNFLKDLQLNVYIELGRTQMQIKDILELERGYIIELDKLASEPVDIFINNKKIAEGEVVVIDKHFGIRITNLVDTGSRLKGLY